jgi:two-component system, OmpR family, alkaline phosphatase synthesis response regulator PhoP
LRLLVVEDDPILAQLTEAVLRRGGFEVRVAGTGAAGLEAARAGGFDAVLLDQQLPDLDGVRVLERLRADPVTAGLPVVVVSAGVEPGQAERIRELGVRGIIQKPFVPTKLAARVRELLGGSG